jgi:hypothetical protein
VNNFVFYKGSQELITQDKWEKVERFGDDAHALLLVWVNKPDE